MIRFLAISFAALALGQPLAAQRQMERLGRGIVALRSSGTQVHVSWRLLGDEPLDIAFNLYRSANGGAAVKVNATPIAGTTDYLDTPGGLGSTAYSYSVRPVRGGVEVSDVWAHSAGAAFSLPANPPTRRYVPVPLQATPDGALDVKFCWVGDLDGDGEYDFVVDRQSGEGARQFLEAYLRNGTLLWRIDLGPNSHYKYNIEPGSSAIGIGHGDNVTVYDMDGDGKAEVLLRTANGVVFGNGAVVSGGASENVQFLSVVDGMTGAELARATAPNPRLFDGPMNGHMGILYLDGKRPSVVWSAKNREGSGAFHGVTTAWDWRNGSLTQRWSWVNDNSIHAPEGHQIRIADVDNDGQDELVDIGYVLDDNGTQLFHISEVVHGDRFHLTDIDPDRPGLENFIIQQNNPSGLATALYEAGTGATIRKWYASSVVDVGRGVAGDFDPAVKGCEFFSTRPGIFDCKGNELSYPNKPFPPETIWWDGDLVREFVSTIGSAATSPGIDKFNTADGSSSRVISLYSDADAPNPPYNNYIAYGGRPQFWGDILGDWREELLCVASDNSELRIYSVRAPDTPKSHHGATFRIPTLMHNPQYRVQATTKGYVQSSYVDYYLGTGMSPPPPPPMVKADLVWRGGSGATVWDNGVTSGWTAGGANAVFAAGKSVLFDIGADNSTPVALQGALEPAAVSCFSPKHHIFDGAAGSLVGATTLMKSGSGSLAITGSHPFTGGTTVWDGALVVDGTLASSPVTVWGGTSGGASAAGLAGGRIAGTGTFGQAVTLGYRGAVTPGAGMGNAGTLTFGNGLAARDGSYFGFDLSNNPTGAAANDRIVVHGDLSLQGKVGIVIHALDGALAPGTYTLATYTGTLTGNASNLTVRVPPGTPYSIGTGSGAITLTVPVTRAPGSVVWRGSGASWDLAASANWLNGGSPDVFVAGDSVVFDGGGAAAATADLATALPVSGVTVDSSADYTFGGAGHLTGSGGLVKSGSGTLTVLTANSYTGPTVVNGGVLAISSLGDAGSPGSIGASGVAAGNLVLNGGTLRLIGPQTNTDRGVTLGAGGGTLDVASAASTITISGSLTGPGFLRKTGPGSLILSNANAHAGGTIVENGVLFLASDTANVSGIGSGGVTLSGGTLRMFDNAATASWASSHWPVHVPAGAAGRLDADSRCNLYGALTGGGDFTFHTPYVRTELYGDWSAFGGRIFAITDADGGDFRIRHSGGYPSAALDLAANVYAYYAATMGSNLTLRIGTLSGASGARLLGGPSSGRTLTWEVGGRNEDSIFAGVIGNSTGPTALTKVGTGTLTLSGACIHTGATTVAAGTLRIAGSLTGSQVAVQNGAALGGTGTVNGNVVLQNGAILEHGNAGGTPLAITGDLSFGAAAAIRPAPGILLGPGQYTVLTYGGTLTGTPALSWQPPPGSNLIATVSTATPGTIIVTLTPAGGNLVWTGSVSQVWDAATANWHDGSSAAIFANGSTVSFTETGNASSPVTLALDVEPEAVLIDAAKHYALGGTGRITGGTSLVKSGTGRFDISAAHTYSGGTYLNAGTLAATTEDASAAIGTGPVIFQGGTLQQHDNASTYSGATYHMQVAAGQSGTLRTDSRMDLNGSLTGVGNLEVYVPWVRFKFIGDWSAFSGRIHATTDADGGLFRIAHAGGLPAAALHLDANVTGLSFFSSTHTMPIGCLSGAPGSFLSGSVPDNNTPPASTVVTWRVGGKDLDSTFAGVIRNGSGSSRTALEKTGAATLILSGASTHTGPTKVEAGRLVVTGSLANTAVTVTGTGELGGDGVIGGPVTCHGKLAPGNSAGVLTVSNNLTLASGSTLEFELGTLSDRVDVTGDLTLAGTLDVKAAPGFGPGTYTLFTYTGAFTDEDGLSLGPLPEDHEAVFDLSTPGQVRLVVTRNLTAFEEWQITHFGGSAAEDAAPDADPDGDGTPNEIEFLLGLDPKNGASAFRAAGSLATDGFTIAWPSAPGLVFEIQRGPSPGGDWETLDSIAGAGVFTDPEPPAGTAFYRVLLRRPESAP